MSFLDLVIRQWVTVAVGVVLIIMAGLIALQRIPIQLTPNVDDTIIAVTTSWEGASPQEIEREIVDEQEEKLQGLSNLRAMTSVSQQGQGVIRLEFTVGTDKDVALREVSDKLREVPDYPANVDEPIVEASDPENRDYIAWIILGTTDPDFDVRILQDFAEDNIKPRLERVNGMSEVNVLGGREREVQIRFDPIALANFGITPTELVTAIRQTNQNISGGELADAKNNVRLRMVAQYTSVEQVEQTIIRYNEGGPVRVGDIAEAVETYKEPVRFVRSRGKPVLAINAQKEVGANVVHVMEGLREVVDRLSAEGGTLDTKAVQLGLTGTLTLNQVYDQTIYIDDAIALVQQNIWLGGGLAVLVLILFLRSVRSVGIIALAIPISVIGAVVAMVAMGRTINVVSLAGMAFAIGLVVDNAIVVLENIFRHLEMGKSPRAAAYDGTREVWGAVLASTLTTVFVFIPILLVQEEAGQLFRDIALAICAAVLLSLLVSISVIPTAAARVLKPITKTQPRTPRRQNRVQRILTFPLRAIHKAGSWLHNAPDVIGRFIYWSCGSVFIRLAVVAVLTLVSLVGSYLLLPPADYLPTGNRNLVFGLLIPPPGYNLDQQAELAKRIEQTIAPFWEAAMTEEGTTEREQAKAQLPSIPTFDWKAGAPGDPIVPPPIENYFHVAFEGTMFHGAISSEPEHVVDLIDLFNHATRAEIAPGVLAFAFQLPLFRLGGSTGAAIKIDLSGDNLNTVTDAASSVYRELAEQFGRYTVQPSPSNFNIFGPELQVVPDKRALADVGLTPADLGLSAQASGDGAIIGEYRLGGDNIDLKLISQESVDRKVITNLEDTPVATPSGAVVPLSALAAFNQVTAAPQINHVGRRRAVTLQFTPPQGMALEAAQTQIQSILDQQRAIGAVPPDVETGFAGSASKLDAVKTVLLGDGTILGTLNSSLILALLSVYLLMCVLFQSFVRPLVIMFSVPLATLGGFLALYAVFIWSSTNRYMPMQQLDVLTMLGFVILIGIVVNNAILIVHQSLNFMRGDGDVDAGESRPMEPRRAIAEAVKSRVRPIFMSTMTSVGGMLPLVLMPGSGSELYRGLGSVVVGGLLVSTIFTILLVPMLFSLVTDLQAALGHIPEMQAARQRESTGGGGTPALATRDPKTNGFL